MNDSPSVSTEPALISIITSCKGRLHHLKQTLPRMLQQAHAEVIVVDYGCPDGTASWLNAAHPEVRVVRVDDDPGFNASRARNKGAEQARGEILFFVDADIILLSDLGAWIKEKAEASNYYLAWPNISNVEGTAIIYKSDFFKVGGYDEAYTGWGGEDRDLYQYLDKYLVARNRFPSELVEPLAHSDADRLKYSATDSRLAQVFINRLYRAVKHDLYNITGMQLNIDTRTSLYNEIVKTALSYFEKKQPDRLIVKIPDIKAVNHSSYFNRNLVYRFRMPNQG